MPVDLLDSEVTWFHRMAFVLQFARYWIFEHVPHLAASLPVLSLMAVTVGVVVAYHVRPPGDLKRRYLEAGEQSLNRKDFAPARTWLRKVWSLGDRTAPVRFSLALCEDQLGRHATSQALLEPLTRAGPSGYGPAHLLQAQDLLARQAPEAQEEAFIQLQRAVERQPNLVEAQILLGNLFLARGQLEKAEAHLEQAAGARPAIHLALVSLCRSRGHFEKAQQHARAALNYFKPGIEQNVGDEVAVLACSQAYAELEEYPAAVSLLQRSLAHEIRLSVRNALGRCYVRWVQSVARKTPADLGSQMRILEDGLGQVPNEPGLLQALLNLGQLPGAEAGRARVLLERQLAQGPPSALLHLMLGLDAHRHEQSEAARIHLEQAYQLSPDAPLISNNLAFLLMNGPGSDLERALTLVDAALRRTPQQPHFHETRGQILVKLGRYREALNDLEIAQRGMPASAPLHLALATTYEKMGMESLAKEHRRLASPKAKSADGL